MSVAVSPRRAALAEAEWTARARAYRERVDRWVAPHLERRRQGRRHPVLDFLFTYYSEPPGRLRRWHPGIGVVLTGPAAAERLAWPRYAEVQGVDSAGRPVEGVGLDLPAFLDRRGEGLRVIADLLRATAGRTAQFGCFGLHEWAMVYRPEPGEVRHAVPLRLGQDGTDAVVEAARLQCTHVDAYRFFSRRSAPLNALRPTRGTQRDLEQPGCLHAGMDLFKWAYKLSPAVPGELLADCLDLAGEIRELDMRASPYDLREHGYPPVSIETAEGKAEYVAAQRGFSARAADLRSRLLDVCDAVMGTPYGRGVSSTRTDRWLRLDGTTNTRDLGGLPTTDGGITVPGRILRSDNLQTLSENDVRRLVEEVGLRQVVDLRTTAEILLEGRGPLRALPQVEHRHFTLLPERGHHTDVFAVEDDDPLDDLPQDWVETLLPRQETPHDAGEPPAVRAYLGYLEHRGEAVVGALRALADAGPGASLVHCAAGKDRTGVVVALALAVAGVPHEEIVADYAMTADVIDALVAKLAASRTYAEDMTRRDVASHTPRAETMRRVLELVDQRFGGPTVWLEQHGLDAVSQQRLRARLRDAAA